jgi:hypothetical protein
VFGAVCMAAGKWGRGGGKCDLKGVHAGLKPSTFERT